MMTEQRMCDPKCTAFKGGVCAVHLQSVEFATVNGVAKVVEICELMKPEHWISHIMIAICLFLLGCIAIMR
jgi:hypothetical protein